jgi:hypothetical protein
MAFLLSYSLSSFAEVRRICKAQYMSIENRHWGKEYTLEVIFLTGQELNKKIGTSKYDFTKNYCQIWFDSDEVAILEIITPLAYLGDEFDREEFRTAFNYNVDLECRQVNSASTRKWRIIAKDYMNFIDPRENN